MEAWRGTGDPRVASPIIYKAQRGLALRHRTGGYAECELPRIPILGTSVNKGRRGYHPSSRVSARLVKK
jgi:hypothetical protein